MTLLPRRFPSPAALLPLALGWALAGTPSAQAQARADVPFPPPAQSQAEPAAGPAWFEGGVATPLAHQAVDLLAAAGEHGLDPRDYGSDRLRQGLASGASVEPSRRAELAAALDSAVAAYLHDLRLGRIDPRSIHHDFNVAQQAYDAKAVLQVVRTPQDLLAVAAAAPPALPQYAQMRQALVLYRLLSAHAAWQRPLPALPGATAQRAGKLEPGQPWDGLGLLSERLVALGDLPAAAVGPAPATSAPVDAASAAASAPSAPAAALAGATFAAIPSVSLRATDLSGSAPVAGHASGPAPAVPVYHPALVAAVRSFQERHGLPVDGLIGRSTHAALQVPPAARVRQIELGLERLRWTPLMQDTRMIVINIPEFMLRAYEVVDGRIAVRAEMKVIVGKALDTRTPLFDEVMRYIEFSPYWNVPPSIARSETLPRLRRDPGYLARQGFEFVGPGGQVSTDVTPGRLDAVLAGQMRIRQRPGPLNALGDIKYVFPNADNIYLHHTPAVSLFERERRDFSHGCIRVEQPVTLANFVLQDQPDWTEARIRAAMTAGTSTTLRLARPVPVLIAYGTSLVKHGRIYFFEDLYGHDRRLGAALDTRSARPGGPRP